VSFVFKRQSNRVILFGPCVPQPSDLTVTERVDLEGFFARSAGESRRRRRRLAASESAPG